VAAQAARQYTKGMIRSLHIWRDRRGDVSVLRIVTLLVLITPVIIALVDAQAIARGARPINDLIHRTGYWALIFLLASLAVTPLRRIARFGGLINVRRMIGVAAFCYAAAHIGLYVADQMYDLAKVASEIARRVYLTIGFTALLGLAALAVTSTDGMVKRLSAQVWQRLHQVVYVIASLALIHYFQQTKADVSVPTLTAGVFGWLIGYRLLIKLKRTRGEPSPWSLLALSVTVAVLTFLFEAIGIGLVFNVSPLRVLETAFDFDPATIRPGWFVLGAGLCVVVLDVVRAWQRRAPRTRLQAASSPL
jgi:sulfoxide reductase heme-binding subunit YedZ